MKEKDCLTLSTSHTTSPFFGSICEDFRVFFTNCKQRTPYLLLTISSSILSDLEEDGHGPVVVPGEVPLLRTQGGEQEQHAEVEHPALVPTLLLTIIVTVSLNLQR